MPKHLAIELSNTYFRFSELIDGKVTGGRFFIIEGRNAVEKKDSLRDSFEQSGLKGHEFDEVTLAWSSRESTLVPSNVFSDSDAGDIYRLCFGSAADGFEIDYNRIAELGVVNVYSIGNWVKSFFVMRYPRIMIQHIGSHLVRCMLHSNAFYLKGSLILFDDHFFLGIARHNDLEFYSSFDYMNADDIIYHLSFVLQQKELNEEKGTIELIAAGNTDPNIINTVKENASKLSNLSKLTFTEAEDYIAKSQLLCV